MRKLVLFVTSLAAGCTSVDAVKLDSNVKAQFSSRTCETRPAGKCTFVNGPAKLSPKQIQLPGRKFAFSLTTETLKFVDANGRNWVAPTGTFTDGASIPDMFVKVIGDPRSKEFLGAATVHDAYCATGNESGAYFQTAKWQEVHRMFYDGLLVGGTPAAKAKIMYAGVFLGGPRWKKVRRVKRTAAIEQSTPTRLASAGSLSRSYALSYQSESKPQSTTLRLKYERVFAQAAGSSLAGLRSKQSNTPLPSQGIQTAKLVSAFKQAISYINTKNPSIDELEVYLTSAEQGLTGTKSRRIKTKAKQIEEGEGQDGGDSPY